MNTPFPLLSTLSHLFLTFTGHQRKGVVQMNAVLSAEVSTVLQTGITGGLQTSTQKVKVSAASYSPNYNLVGLSWMSSKHTTPWSASFSGEETWGLLLTPGSCSRQTQRHEGGTSSGRGVFVGADLLSTHLHVWVDRLEEFITQLAVPQRHERVLRAEERGRRSYILEGKGMRTCWLDTLTLHTRWVITPLVLNSFH